MSVFNKHARRCAHPSAYVCSLHVFLRVPAVCPHIRDVRRSATVAVLHPTSTSAAARCTAHSAIGTHLSRATAATHAAATLEKYTTSIFRADQRDSARAAALADYTGGIADAEATTAEYPANAEVIAPTHVTASSMSMKFL